MPAFMLSISDAAFQTIADEAKARRVTVQTLIRAVVIPEWTRYNQARKAPIVPDPELRVDSITSSMDAQVTSQSLTASIPRHRAVDLYRAAYFRSLRR